MTPFLSNGSYSPASYKGDLLLLLYRCVKYTNAPIITSEPRIIKIIVNQPKPDYFDIHFVLSLFMSNPSMH